MILRVEHHQIRQIEARVGKGRLVCPRSDFSVRFRKCHRKKSRVYFRSKITIFRAKPWFSTKITYFEHVLPLKRHGTCYFGVNFRCETKSKVIKTQRARIFAGNHWFSSQNRDFHAKVRHFACDATVSPSLLPKISNISLVKSLKVSKSNLETFLVCMFACLGAKMVKILKMVPSSHLKFRIFTVPTFIDPGTPNNFPNVFLCQFRNFLTSHRTNIFELLSRKTE